MNSNPNVSKTFIWLFCLLVSLLLLQSPVLAANPVGSFQFVHGDVSIQRNGQALEASRGDDVFVGDTLVTAAASSAQLKMVDGARMALRPRSELVVDEYNFNDDDDDSSLVSLTRGGLRTVTGALGRARPDKVKIDTPVATMGIRGTDMDTFFTPDPEASSLEDTEAVLRVNEGTGFITSGGVELDVPAGNIAAATLGQPPRNIPSLPPAAQALENESTQSSDDEATGSDEESTDTPEESAAEEESDANTLAGEGEEVSLDQLLGEDELDGVLPNLDNLGLTQEDIRTIDENLKQAVEENKGTTISIQ